MMAMFDKGIQLRMGQAHVKCWVDDLMFLVDRDGDPLGTGDLATPTHDLPLTEAPHGYDIFQRKVDGCIKVVLHP
jgi:threonine dehydrogenase-like Zn-dependent dehydrogenase